MYSFLFSQFRKSNNAAVVGCIRQQLRWRTQKLAVLGNGHMKP